MEKKEKIKDMDLTFIDYIESRKIDWAIQIAQNVFSITGMVPLRLYDLNRSKKVWNSINGKIDDQNILKLKNDMFSLINDLNNPQSKYYFLKDTFSKRNNSPWRTRASYCHPLIADFRHSKCFRTWEQVFFYQILTSEKFDHKNFHIIKFLRHFHVGIKRLNVEEEDIYLVAGPIFRPPADGAGEQFEIQRLIPFLDDMKKKLCGRNIKLNQNSNMWALLGTMRPWWNEMDLEDILCQSVKSFQSLFSLKLSEDYILKRSVCRQIALACWTINSVTMETVLNSLKLSYGTDNFKRSDSIVSITIPIESKNIDPQIFHSVRKQNDWSSNLDFMGKIDNLLLRLNLDQAKINPFSKLLRTEQEIDTDKLEKKYNKQINSFFRAIQRRLISLEESYSQEKLLYLLNWFHRKFGLIPVDLHDGKYPKTKLEAFCDRISREIVQLLNSDICSIYLYDYQKDIVKQQGYYINKLYLESEERYQKIIGMLKYVESVTDDSSERSQSMNYRVMDTNQSRFCRAVIKNKNGFEFIPSHEEMLYKNCNYLRSGISVPITVNGINLGVLGIGGYSQHQFRKQNVQLLERISQIVSPYIYQALFISSLSNLTDEILKATKDIEQKYMDICNTFCRLFLAHGAVLWMPGKESSDRYFPKGWSETRNDFELNKNEFCDIRSEDSTFKIAFENNFKNITFKKIKISKILETFPKWFASKKYRQWLKMNKIEDILIIPLVLEDQDYPFAMVSLYYKNKFQGLNNSWEAMIAFIADYLTLLLDSLIKAETWKKRFIEVINHELKQLIDLISTRADDILGYLPQQIRKIKIGKYGSRSPVWLLFSDLKSFTKSARHVFNKLQDEKFIKKTQKTKIHPILIYLDISDFPDEKLSIRNMYNEITRARWSERKAKNVSLEYKISHQLPYLKMPSIHFHAIFSNLYKNAVKYSIPDSIIFTKVVEKTYTLEIHIINEAKPLNSIEEKYSLFNERYRGSNKEDIDGDGIGLYVTRLYCEYYDGEISIDIEPLKKNAWKYDFAISFPKLTRCY